MIEVVTRACIKSFVVRFKMFLFILIVEMRKLRHMMSRVQRVIHKCKLQYHIWDDEEARALGEMRSG